MYFFTNHLPLYYIPFYTTIQAPKHVFIYFTNLSALPNIIFITSVYDSVLSFCLLHYSQLFYFSYV